MSSNYTGNPIATEGPAPAPGPGTVPIANLPADGDALAASSVTQAFKVNTDYVAHLQSVAKFRPPRAPNGVSGFTTVTHVGSGPSNGIAPAAISATLSQPTYSPYNFVYKIIAGGAIGAATFQVSLDGGNTFGGTTTTAATYTEPTSGVAVAMTGTQVASDTYAFSCTDTPMAGFVDSSANNRGLVVDHLGLPGGKWSDIREDWAIGTSFSLGTGQTGIGYPTGVPRWLGTTGASGGLSIAIPVTTYGNNVITLSPGTTAASVAKLVLNNPAGIYNSNNTSTIIVLEFELGINSTAGTGSSIVCGLGSVGSANGLFLSQQSGSMAIQMGFTTTGPFTVLNFTATNSTSPNMRIRFEFGGSGTFLSGVVRAFCNEQMLVATNSYTGQWASLTDMIPYFLATSGGATAATYTLGPVRCMWNRWSNPGLL